MPTIYGATLKDSRPILVTVQSTTTTGIPNFFLHGLSALDSNEAKRTLQVLLKTHRVRIPKRKILTQVAPAHIPNTNHSLDFALAVSLLSLKNTVSPTRKTLYLGAITVEGNIIEVPGIFALALEAKEQGSTHFCVPASIASKVAQLTQQQVFGFVTLQEYMFHCTRQKAPIPLQPLPKMQAPTSHYFSQIAGQHSAKRALAISIAGKHPLLLIGPPGNGKTLLAQAATELQPALSTEEFLHVQKMQAQIYGTNAFQYERPFINPSHTTPFSELFGSQRSHSPSLLEQAHTGTLFLDELPEFSKKILTALRTPLENKQLSRTVRNQQYSYPFDCTIIAAANPCPCGYYQIPLKECHCSSQAITHFKSKLSGPLTDRFHLCARMPLVDAETLAPTNKTNTETALKKEFLTLRAAIQKARNHQAIKSNSLELPLTHSADSLLQKAHRKLQLSARSNKNCQKVAQTISILEGEKSITADHIAEALQYRIQ